METTEKWVSQETYRCIEVLVFECRDISVLHKVKERDEGERDARCDSDKYT